MSQQVINDVESKHKRSSQVEVYRRQKTILTLVSTFFLEDELTSPLLPGFSCVIDRLFI